MSNDTVQESTLDQKQGEEDTAVATSTEECDKNTPSSLAKNDTVASNETSSSSPNEIITNTTQDNGPLFLNRFSNWGQQAKATAVTTLFRRTNSSPTSSTSATGILESSLPSKTSIVSLETATLSPKEETHLPSPFFTRATTETNVVEIVEEDDPIDSKGEYSSTENTATGNNRNSNRGVTALQWAASNVLDSVQQQTTYFRGRYNRENSQDTKSSTEQSVTTSTTSKQTGITASFSSQSQTARIMSSPHASHMQSLIGKDRPPNEFVMLLGRGMLGVNLKQTYLKHQGVYVDYLVPRGSAERSGVIYVGDALLSVGSVDVRKSNIWNVPQIIASAARPVHLILSTSGISSEMNLDRITYVDACIGLLYHYHILDRVHEEPLLQMESSFTVSDSDSEEESCHDEDKQKDHPNEDVMELISPTSFDEAERKKDDDKSPDIADDIQVDLLDSVDQFINPDIPSEALQKCVLHHVAKRCNEFEYEHIRNDLTQLAANSSNFRATLRNAFLTCVVDCRRFPFLRRHFSCVSEYEIEMELASTANQDQNIGTSSSSDVMLQLFSDMLNYSVMFPLSSRQRRLEMANRIAFKYFLPSSSNTSELIPPEFDFHHIVSDTTLRSLETALKKPELLTQETFMEFQRSIADSLSYETPLLSFLVSKECARMRAYLRNTAPFVNIPLDRVIKLATSEDACNSVLELSFAKNYILYLLVYLLTLTDRESFGENDDLFEQNFGMKKGGETNSTRYTRVDNAAMNLCAYLFIQKRVLPLIHQQLKQQQTKNQSENSTRQNLQDALRQLWEVYVAPILGDDHKGEHLIQFADYLRDFSSNLKHTGDIFVIEDDMLRLTQELSDELLYDYATNHHSKFQAHKFHEWLCEEIYQSRRQHNGSTGLDGLTLPSSCIKRLLRKVQWPNGVTPHKPSLHSTIKESEASIKSYPHDGRTRHNAECAIVFGSNRGVDSDPLKRFLCESLVDDAYNTLQPAEILPTLESYAMVSSNHIKPFRRYNQDTALYCQVDGWDVSLIDFMIPRADVSTENGDSALFGVSLIFRFQCYSDARKTQHELPLMEKDLAALDVAMNVIRNANRFRQKLAESTWTDYAKSDTSAPSEPVIGLALVGQRNVIPAMRATLISLARSFSASDIISGERVPPLVDILGNFDHHDIEDNVLSRILKPFIDLGSAPWVDLPLDTQKDQFIDVAGNQLIDSLPPIPLALLFVSALLEQKIVFSSSRLSILLSAATAVCELLKPLKWCHLFVPRVPISLASDIVQYPAPFIIGIPSEEPGMLDLIRNLPQDVTLVDLDVGRVILASSLSNNEEVGRSNSESTEEITKKLRLQVLYLAQSLGNVFGQCLQHELWLCDKLQQSDTDKSTSRFDKLCRICNSFVNELVNGVSSCCFWIEECSAKGYPMAEPTIVLDEDRFFKVKETRHLGVEPVLSRADDTLGNELALSVKEFDLILKLLLRCQSMNDYIGKRQKNEMAFFF